MCHEYIAGRYYELFKIYQLSVKMVDISVLGGMLIDVFSIGLRENN